MRLNKKQFRNVVTEEVTKLLGEVMLAENAQSKKEKLPRRAIIKYYKEYKGTDVNEETLKDTFDEIRRKFPNIRLPQDEKRLWCYSWSPAVIRMYLSGALNGQEEQDKMNEILKYLSEEPEFAKQYDSELNHETIEQLSAQITPLIDKKETESSARITAKHNAEQQSGKQIPSDYTVVKIPDYETAVQYAKYMDPVNGWCITHDEDMYDRYTNKGTGLFYFFLKKGFENVPEVVGENAPLDEYGLSMIAVNVGEKGEIKNIVSRWNHENGGGDNVMTKDQLYDVTHLDPSVVCPPYTEEELEKKGIIYPEKVLKEIENGARPEDVFKEYYIDGDNEDVLYLHLNNRWYEYYRPDNYFINSHDNVSEVYFMRNIIIPDKINTIEEETFLDCNTLTSVTMHNKITSIKDAAFEYCYNLTSITIPNSITSIGNNAFAYCGFASITIPNSVKTMGRGVFYGCNSLTSVTIPNNITTIDVATFYRCKKLSSITIPDSIQFIHNCAFSGCSSLTSVTIPSSVAKIGDYAFYECSGLKTVYIKNKNVTIGKEVFPWTAEIIYVDNNGEQDSKYYLQQLRDKVLGNNNNNNNKQEQESQSLREVRENFNSLLKRMDGLFI